MKKMMTTRAKRIFILILSVIITWLGCYGQWFYSLDTRITDALYQRPGILNPQIKLIAIDEKTLDRLGAFGTWDRQVYGRLTDRLEKEAAPSIIAFDIIFAESMAAEGDREFAEACKRGGNVIIAQDVVNKKTVVTKGDETYLDALHVERVLYPYEALAQGTKSGFAEAIMDEDGYIRHSLWSLNYRGEEIKSFARIIAEDYAWQHHETIDKPKTDQYARFGFTYSGKPGDYEKLSFIDVLDGKVDLGYLKDCILLVGAYSDGMQDNYFVASDRRGGQMYGVEVQANIVQALLEGKTYMAVDPRLMATIWTFVMAIFLLVIVRLRLRGTLITTAVTIAASAVAGILLYRAGFYIEIVTVPIFACLFCLIKIVATYVGEVLKRRHLTNAFKRYVAPQVVDRVMRKQDFQIEVKGETKDIAVLFADVRAFTSLSEDLTPQEVVKILNMQMNMASQAIFHQGGMLDKFIGDAAMAVFNAPVDLDDYEYKAVCAAVEIIKGSQELAQAIDQEFGRKVELAVGVHCGPAVIGNMGSEMRLDYTAIGNTVNTAARIEGEAQGGQVLISETMKERLEGRIKVKEIGPTPLKGKKEEIVLYEVMELV